MNMKTKIILSSAALLILFVFIKFTPPEKVSSPETRDRTIAGHKETKNSSKIASQENYSNEVKVPEEEKTFIKDYEANSEINISEDQRLLISDSVFSVLKDFYDPSIGEKVTENFDFVEFKPTKSPSSGQLPVVFNSLIQTKGYLTGYISYIYKSEPEKRAISGQVVSLNAEIFSIDEDTKIITAKYYDMDSLKELMKIYPTFEVEVKYGPVVPH